MKRILVLLLLLISSSACWAGETKTAIGVADSSIKTIVGVATASAKTLCGVDYDDGDVTCADSSCTGFLVCQNFEGTGYDNSESWSTAAGTPNADYTTTHLRGDQSLYCKNTCMAYITISAQSELYAHFRFQTDGLAADQFVWADDASHDIGLYLTADGHIKAYNHTTTATGTYAISANTTYHVWYYYKKGTGSNGITTVWISDTTTKPGTADITITNGNSTYDVTRIGFGYIANQIMVHDQVLVSTSEIGNVCD